MAKKGSSSFHVNELVAIQLALESHNDDINGILSDDSTDFLLRPKMQENLRWASSALEKVHRILDSSPLAQTEPR